MCAQVLLQSLVRNDDAYQREVVHRGRVEATFRELHARDVEKLSTTLVGREAHRRGTARVGHPLVLDFKGIS